MLDDLFNLIYSWGHRYLLEIGLTVAFFVLIHFVGYPFLIRRHDSQVQQQTPSIKTGDIITNGDNSPITVGVEPRNNGALKNAQPQK
jgi:hypothetical protein